MDTAPPFVSKLNTAPMRLLAEALEHSLVSGRRTPQDFIRHFPPDLIMSALEGQPRLRSLFLITLVGLREKTALRTPASDAGRLLQAALEERDTDPDSIVRTFERDDRIRYLDPQKVWAFLLEGEFWRISRSKDLAGHKVAQSHLAYLIERGIAHGLITHADVIDGITIEVLGEKLPRAELAKLIRRALDLGKAGHSFTHAEAFDAVPPTVIVDHIALNQVYESVILPLARAAGYSPGDKSATEKPPAGDKDKVSEKRVELSEDKRADKAAKAADEPARGDEWSVPPAADKPSSAEPN